jgi:hypothetical protein
MRRPAGKLAGWGRSHSPKGGLKSTLTAEVLAELSGFLGERALADLGLETMETLVRHKAIKVAASFLEHRLNADASDYADAALPCRGCGAPARYVDRRAKSLITCLGDLTVERAYYHCAACGQGWCPKADAIGCGDAVRRLLPRYILGCSRLSRFPPVTACCGAAAGRIWCLPVVRAWHPCSHRPAPARADARPPLPAGWGPPGGFHRILLTR